MSATVVYRDRRLVIERVRPASDGLWITFDTLEKVFGWTVRPEGVCKGQLCVPVPPEREPEFWPDGAFDLAALSALLGETVVHSDDSSIWVFPTPASQLRERIQSLEAPDFALPDLDGRVHRLSDYRGSKVLLIAWASW